MEGMVLVSLVCVLSVTAEFTVPSGMSLQDFKTKVIALCSRLHMTCTFFKFRLLKYNYL